MLLNKKDIKALAQAIQLWLDFEALCKGKDSLSKDSLSHPIFGFLLGHGIGPVQKEWAHPSITKGHIDYVCLKYDQPVLAIGTQWIGDATLDKQRLIETLLNLHYLNCPERYFLLAGKLDKFESRRHKLQVKGEPEELFEPLLPINSGGPQIEIPEAGEPWREEFDRFARQHETELPKSLRLWNIHDGHGEYARVLLWQVGF
jgi:hypothetical protein